MKELTIEQKAKAYDEALERAKELLEVGLKDTKDKRVVLSFFPELAESEGERIRKVLIDYFNQYKEQEECGVKTFYGIPTDDILAWLEKKGEQKSAEWSEEDENLLKLSIENLTELKDRFGEEYGKVGDCIVFLESIKDRVQPQPKQEWSEEDDTYSDLVITAIKLYYTDDKGEENPWREELLRWLKSLKDRYTWKPSEEMLEALYRVIPENTMEISEDEMLLDKLYQGLKYGRVLSNR